MTTDFKKRVSSMEKNLSYNKNRFRIIEDSEWKQEIITVLYRAITKVNGLDTEVFVQGEYDGLNTTEEIVEEKSNKILPKNLHILNTIDCTGCNRSKFPFHC